MTAFILLALITFVHAVSLSDFRPSASGLTGPCGSLYTTAIPSCNPSDFLEGASCSQTCISSLLTLSMQVQDMCGGQVVNAQGVVQAFLVGQGTNALCPNALASTIKGGEGQATATSLPAGGASIVTSASLAAPTSYPDGHVSSWALYSSGNASHSGYKSSAGVQRASSLPAFVPSSRLTGSAKSSTMPFRSSSTPASSTTSYPYGPTTSTAAATSTGHNNPPPILTISTALQTQTVPTAASTLSTTPGNSNANSQNASSADCRGSDGGMMMNGHHCAQSSAAGGAGRSADAATALVCAVTWVAVVWGMR